MTRLLGVDLGERRIGLAIAEDAGGARPLTTLSRARTTNGDAEAIASLVAEHRIDEVIVGLPLEASGIEGDQARRTRAWVDAVAATVGRRMSYRDERLTSHLAEQRLGPMPRGRSGGPPTAHQRATYRARVDREAAAIILQDELDARSGTAGRATTGSTT